MAGLRSQRQPQKARCQSTGHRRTCQAEGQYCRRQLIERHKRLGLTGVAGVLLDAFTRNKMRQSVHHINRLRVRINRQIVELAGISLMIVELEAVFTLSLIHI